MDTKGIWDVLDDRLRSPREAREGSSNKGNSETGAHGSCEPSKEPHWLPVNKRSAGKAQVKE